MSPYGAVEEPLWFGPEGRPLFGWFSAPSSESASGGVLLVPTVGREARAPRRAYRELAQLLAARGVASLRFDYEGTGDSSGSFGEPGQDGAWVEDVAVAYEFLASLGIETISAVGIRLGATIMGVSAAQQRVSFSSMVLWDPCESGRHYLRELSALESVRRTDFEPMSEGFIQTAEYVFPPQMSKGVAGLSLSELPTESRLAKRVLVVTRDDRVTSERLRRRLNLEHAEWTVTTEQRALVDVDPLDAVMPSATLDEIANWLCSDSASVRTPLEIRPRRSAVVVDHPTNDVRERIVMIGPRQLFGIVSEPSHASDLPWIIMTNVANEEHIGISRTWVELSRQWSQSGFRCLRFDLSGLGDSSWSLGDDDRGNTRRELYDSTSIDDLREVTRWVSGDDPSNTVFVGMCSGAYFAIEAGLDAHSRGVCAINPPIFVDMFHSLARFERSRIKLVRVAARALKRYALKEWWWASALWYMCRMMRPGDYPVATLNSLARTGTDVYVLDEGNISPFRRTPIFRKVDIRRLSTGARCRLEFVPGLDHSMFNAEGRERTVEKLRSYVLERFSEG